MKLVVGLHKSNMKEELSMSPTLLLKFVNQLESHSANVHTKIVTFTKSWRPNFTSHLNVLAVPQGAIYKIEQDRNERDIITWLMGDWSMRRRAFWATKIDISRLILLVINGTCCLIWWFLYCGLIGTLLVAVSRWKEALWR